MQISPIQQNNTDPSFGVHYSKKTVRTLKKVTPEILRWTKNEEDYNLVKSAIKHLINAGKKIDDFCVELNNNETNTCDFQIRAKKLQENVTISYIHHTKMAQGLATPI